MDDRLGFGEEQHRPRSTSQVKTIACIRRSRRNTQRASDGVCLNEQRFGRAKMSPILTEGMGPYQCVPSSYC
jgi:hypothetical protein